MQGKEVLPMSIIMNNDIIEIDITEQFQNSSDLSVVRKIKISYKDLEKIFDLFGWKIKDFARDAITDIDMERHDYE